MPMRTPMASEIVTAPAIEEAMPRWLCNNRATAIEMTPAIAPTERSMPPVMMTKVWPMARIAIIAPWRRRLDMLLALQKVRVSIDSASHMASNSASRVRPVNRSSRPTARFLGMFVSLMLPVPPLFFRSDADRLGQNRFVRGVLIGVALRQAAAPENVQRVGEFVDLRKVGRDHDDAGAGLEQRGEQAIDFRLGADIDADRWFIEDKELGAVIEPLADHDFLLVAARQTCDRRGARSRLDLDIAHLNVRSGGFAPDINQRAETEPLENRQIDVEADAHIEA